MNDVGIALAWTAARVTLVLLPALALHALASRRGPAAGSWVASWALGLAVALGLTTVLPSDFERGVAPAPVASAGPSSSTPARKTVAVAAEPGRRGDDPTPPLTVARSWTWPIAGFRVAWGRFERRAAVPTARWRHWGTALATVALAGMSLGLGRLFLGVWAVHLCRRQGRPVDDPALCRLLDEIKGAMGCRRRVEVRAVADLTTPAAAGWLRPAVLLPDDWRTWDEDERRAVLAHELAHVHRSDYATGLLAQVALAVHFYHPCVLWLAGRLQLEQELAADALGARFAGGRACYLQALSRLALRQDGRSPSWPARAFLPSRGTLIRRIAMLRDETKSVDRPWTGPRRVLAASLLLAVALGAAMMRGPAFGADEDAPGGKDQRSTTSPRQGAGGPGLQQQPFPNRSFADVITEVERRPVGRNMVSGTKDEGPFVLGELTIDGNERVIRREVEPFDLSFIPDEAMGLVAFHPAMAFRRDDMKRFVAPLNAGIAALLKEMKVSEDPAKCPLRVEAIEQVSAGIGVRELKNQKGPNRAFMTHGLTVRTIEPFDWSKQIRAWWPDLVEVHDEGRVYFKGTKNLVGLGPKGCIYVPDSRTVVICEEEGLLPMIRRVKPAVPEYVRGEDKDWERASRSLVAVAIDNRDGRWTRAFKGSGAEPIGFPPLVEHVDRWIFHYDDTDDIDFRGVGTCSDDEAAEATVHAVGAFFDTCRRLSRECDPDGPGGMEPHVAYRAMLDAVTKCRVAREGRRVVLRPDGLGKIAELIRLIAENAD